ncbi:MAG: hypothetical protein EOS61_18265, partial [Mesorhizobium sp.]
DTGIWARVDIGGNDEIHGETGDDFVYAGGGGDVVFGDADDDDIVGGWGSDWISGGTGIDGILGDDGRIFTSRNTSSQANAENLYGVLALRATDPDTRTSQGDVLNELIRTPGDVQVELINVAGALTKSVDLTPFNLTAIEIGAADPFLSDQQFADDVIFGGLGQDFLHGGSGDDAISGAEALGESYAPRFDSLGNFVGLIRTDFSRPYNPGDILHFGSGDPHWNEPKPVQSRTGEFFLYNEYDPRRVILFDGAAGHVWDGPTAANGGLPPINQDGITGGTELLQYFLNWRSDEGVSVLGYVAFKPDGQTPDPTVPQEYRQSDGDDRIFGDLGNDWIIGGTGRDHIYGGFGNDLMNADDYLGTINPNPPNSNPGQLPLHGTDESPDTHWSYEDRVFGGAGLDILIGNTKGDRLIDWVGEFNSYIVPFAPFGIATVSRQVPPHLFDFLYAQAFGDGVDITRYTDTGTSNHNQRYSNVTTMQGGIDGEIGLVTQQDHGYWQSQTGGPTDPQAGNVPGGRRDVLRTATFNDGTLDVFAADQGKFAVSNAAMSVQSNTGTDQAAAVFYADQYLPVYFEVTAKITAEKPLAGWKANTYIIFDYQSPTDFKYAGINVSTNQIEMGYRDASGWHQLVKSNKPVQLKAGTAYDVLVAVNGTNVTVSVAGVNQFSYTFAPRIENGEPQGLNKGMIGVGNQGAKGVVDNFTLQILPPELTLDYTDQFDNAQGRFPLAGTAGWTFSNGRLIANGGAAANTFKLGASLAADSYLEVETKLSTATIGGIVFDSYAANDYKFVTLDVVNDKVVVGHVSPKGGMTIDASFTKVLDANVDYSLRLIFKGASVSIQVNGGLVGTYGYNSVLVDGQIGLMTGSGATSFDRFQLRTNDLFFNTASSLMAASSGTTVNAVNLTAGAPVNALLDQAVTVLKASGRFDDEQIASLSDITIDIVQLDGRTLGRYENGTVFLDTDAAGNGWFVDLTPVTAEEFTWRDGKLVAVSGGAADGRIDLLSVLIHELGHGLGLSHDDGVSGGLGTVMGEVLAVGERRLPTVDADAGLSVTAFFDEGLGGFVSGSAGGNEERAASIELPLPVATVSTGRTASSNGSKSSDGGATGFFDEQSGVFVEASEFELMRFAKIGGNSADDAYVVVEENNDNHREATPASSRHGDDGIEELSGMIEWEARTGLLQRLAGLFSRVIERE